ncbi:hypothetical protein [Ruegeria atlantica]|uniref:hypothetical protein n=1 Tax=Ruegeria atlantica TaxID=81569 RepID=UPI00147BE63B|nr:hypothetical protein [Ruegeria atlantica]
MMQTKTPESRYAAPDCAALRGLRSGIKIKKPYFQRKGGIFNARVVGFRRKQTAPLPYQADQAFWGQL